MRDYILVSLCDELVVEIEPLKARHDVIKLELIVPLLSFWCIDIDLNIQPMSFTLFMTCMH